MKTHIFIPCPCPDLISQEVWEETLRRLPNPKHAPLGADPIRFPIYEQASFPQKDLWNASEMSPTLQILEIEFVREWRHRNCAWDSSEWYSPPSPDHLPLRWLPNLEEALNEWECRWRLVKVSAHGEVRYFDNKGQAVHDQEKQYKIEELLKMINEKLKERRKNYGEKRNGKP